MELLIPLHWNYSFFYTMELLITLQRNYPSSFINFHTFLRIITLHFNYPSTRLHSECAHHSLELLILSNELRIQFNQLSYFPTMHSSTQRVHKPLIGITHPQQWNDPSLWTGIIYYLFLCWYLRSPPPGPNTGTPDRKRRWC